MSRSFTERQVRPRVSRSRNVDAIISSRLDGAALGLATSALDGVHLNLSVRFDDDAVLPGSDAAIAQEVLEQLAALFTAAAGGSPKPYCMVG